MEFGGAAAAGGGVQNDASEAALTYFALRLEADKTQLSLLQEFVEGHQAALQLRTDAIYDMLCALTEIVTNSIVHGYAGQAGSIDVHMWTAGADLYVRVFDYAPAFDPTSVPAPDTTVPLEARPRGGMGIHVARRYTDAMTYRALPQGGNELILVRNQAVEPITDEQGEA